MNDQPGLRMRMGREAGRVSSQHEQLNAFYQAVSASIQTGDAERAPEHFGRFSDALDAHITMEDQVFFPALHGMRPQFESDLAQLVGEHRGFREDLQRVADHLSASAWDAAHEQLEALGRALADHEAREEALIQRITSK